MNRWCRDPRVLSRRTASRFALLCPGGDDVVVLEGLAAVVWEFLADPIEEDVLFRMLADAFAIDQETAQQDVRPFLMELRGVGAAVKC
jgi:hypothetical protein